MTEEKTNVGLLKSDFEHECRVRNCFRDHLGTLRPGEELHSVEVQYKSSKRRADMRTVTQDNVILEWEFKIRAGVDSIGQVLNYVRIAREEFCFAPVRGVIAALGFENDVVRTCEVMNLGIELVKIPIWMHAGGKIPRSKLHNIPENFNNLIPKLEK
jgi:hypothetical protein